MLSAESTGVDYPALSPAMNDWGYERENYLNTRFRGV